MAVTIFSTNFASTSNGALPVTCGVPDSVLNGISNRYIVTFSAKRSSSKPPFLIVNAYLQDKFILEGASSWEDLSQMFGGVSDLADTGTQLVTGLASAAGLGSPRSLISAASTRRKWKGSKPVTIKMKLVLEAVSNPYLEVILPALRLQQLALPGEGNNNQGGFFLIPPGPSPFDIGSLLQIGTIIEMSLGGFLNFTYQNCGGVLVEGVTISYENRMSASGPIGATVDLTISTYQMLTQEALARIHGSLGTSQTNTGLGTPTPGSSAGAGG